MRLFWVRSAALAGLVAGVALLAGGVDGAPEARRFETSAGAVEVVRLAGDLDAPWAAAPLPGGGALVTERGGRLWRFDADWRRQAVAGVPEVHASNQGGLLDVTLARDFAATRTLFLTYAEPAEGGARTAMARARLSQDGARLEGVTALFR
jgi:glucose/arabinose dehydrogenase